jgi:hypothetical protein
MASAKKRLSNVQIGTLGHNWSDLYDSYWCYGALTGLPPLDLVIQGVARSVAHRLWSLGCWSYFHPNQGYSCISMRLQMSDPIFSTGVDVMKPLFNLEPKYRVAMLIREEWTRGPGTPPAVKGLVWFTGWSRTV